MRTLIKPLAILAFAACSSAAFACSQNPYDGVYLLNGKTVTITEKPRCSYQFIYQEWRPSQRPNKGKPLLRLKSAYTGNFNDVHFKKRATEYILTIPKDAKPFEKDGNEDIVDKITLEVLKKGKAKQTYTLKRIK